LAQKRPKNGQKRWGNDQKRHGQKWSFFTQNYKKKKKTQNGVKKSLKLAQIGEKNDQKLPKNTQKYTKWCENSLKMAKIGEKSLNLA
jgi:hypothetical protein